MIRTAYDYDNYNNHEMIKCNDTDDYNTQLKLVSSYSFSSIYQDDNIVKWIGSYHANTIHRSNAGTPPGMMLQHKAILRPMCHVHCVPPHCTQSGPARPLSSVELHPRQIPFRSRLPLANFW